MQAHLQQKDAQLGQHVTRIQQLTTQLREKDDRLRQREEELQLKEIQLREKREELQQRNSDIIRLQEEIRSGGGGATPVGGRYALLVLRVEGALEYPNPYPPNTRNVFASSQYHDTASDRIHD